MTVHQLHLNVGAIVQAIHGVARQAQPAVSQVLERFRASRKISGGTRTQPGTDSKMVRPLWEMHRYEVVSKLRCEWLNGRVRGLEVCKFFFAGPATAHDRNEPPAE